MRKQRVLVLLAFSGLLGLAVIIGCSSLGEGFLFPGTGNTFFEPKFLFAYSFGGVSAFAVNASTGALTPATGSPFAVPGGNEAQIIDADPNSRFVYVPQSDNTIVVFSVGSGGVLTQVNGSPFDIGANFTFAAKTDPTGQFLYVTDRGADVLYAFTVGAGGTLTPITGSPFATSVSPEGIIMDPRGRFLYVSHASDYGWFGIANDTLDGFAIGTNGALTPITGSPFSTGEITPRFGTITPDGSTLYVADRGDDTGTHPGAVAAFSIGANGALSAVSGSPFLVGAANTPMGPIVAAIDPAGRFVYTSNLDASCCPGTQAVSVFSVGANGALTAISGSPFNLSLEWAHWITIDPSGKFAYALDADNDQIQGFTVGTNGQLTPLTGTPFTDSGLSFPTSLVVSH